MKRAIVINKHFEFMPIKVQKMEQNNIPMDVSLIVDPDRISKNSALSLVELAKEIEKANANIKTNTCMKLKVIVDQMQYLTNQAASILKDAQRNTNLHEVSCNFLKQSGHIYHLYERPSGDLYFSMISPEEWGKSSPPQEYKGSFRLENDKSWTPVSEIENEDAKMKYIQNIVDNRIFSKHITECQSDT